MQELIKVTAYETIAQSVSAKELYLGLGLLKSEWSNWSKRNIEKNDFFKANDDWIGFRVVLNGNESMDYAITLEFAKHIAMQAKTEKSHIYRQYMIECERKAVSNIPAIANPQIAAMMMALQAVDRLEQEQANQKQLLIEQQAQINDIKAKAISSPHDFYSIAGYASLRGVNVDIKAAAALGRRAVKLSHELDLPIYKAHSEVHGSVNTYHVDCLCTLFSEK